MFPQWKEEGKKGGGLWHAVAVAETVSCALHTTSLHSVLPESGQGSDSKQAHG